MSHDKCTVEEARGIQRTKRKWLCKEPDQVLIDRVRRAERWRPRKQAGDGCERERSFDRRQKGAVSSWQAAADNTQYIGRRSRRNQTACKRQNMQQGRRVCGMRGRAEEASGQRIEIRIRADGVDWGVD